MECAPHLRSLLESPVRGGWQDSVQSYENRSAMQRLIETVKLATPEQRDEFCAVLNQMLYGNRTVDDCINFLTAVSKRANPQQRKAIRELFADEPDEPKTWRVWNESKSEWMNGPSGVWMTQRDANDVFFSVVGIERQIIGPNDPDPSKPQPKTWRLWRTVDRKFVSEKPNGPASLSTEYGAKLMADNYPNLIAVGPNDPDPSKVDADKTWRVWIVPEQKWLTLDGCPPSQFTEANAKVIAGSIPERYEAIDCKYLEVEPRSKPVEPVKEQCNYLIWDNNHEGWISFENRTQISPWSCRWFSEDEAIEFKKTDYSRFTIFKIFHLAKMQVY